MSSAAVGRYFTLNILLITRLICFCCKIFYFEHFTHYHSCHPAAVARYFTMNILLIIHRVLCCCCKIFNLEHFTYYSSCPLLLLEDILFAVGTFYSLFIVSYLPLLNDILSGIFTGSIIFVEKEIYMIGYTAKSLARSSVFIEYAGEKLTNANFH